MVDMEAGSDPAQLVTSATDTELSLIAEEQKAEKRVAGCRAKLDQELKKLQKAQRRADERSEDLARAEQVLKVARERRLKGVATSPADTTAAAAFRPPRDDPPDRD